MNIYIFPIFAVVGSLVIFLWRPKKLRSIKLLLAFSGAFLLGTTLTSLLPSVFTNGSEHISYLILAGIIIQILLEQLSKVAEHGHNPYKREKNSDDTCNWSLFTRFY